MPQSIDSVLLHLVYSTKLRRPWVGLELAPKLHAYQASIFQSLGCPALIVNGMPDHVHALFRLSRTQRICDVVEEVKRASSKWIKTQSEAMADFSWQSGYAVFSLGESRRQDAYRYIETQEEHHASRSFQDEMRSLFAKYRILYDERYVWE